MLVRRTSMIRACGTSPVCLVIWSVWSIWFVLLLDQEKPNKLNKPNKRDRPDRLNRPNEQDRLAGFFSILLNGLFLSARESDKPLGLKK